MGEAMQHKTNRYGLKRFSREKEEFIQFYEDTLKEEVALLEKKRSKFVKAFKSRITLIILVALISIPVWIFLNIFYGIFICLPMIGELFQFTKKNKHKIEQEMKEKVVSHLVHFMNPNFTYEPDGHMSASDLNAAGVFRSRARHITGDDLITGYVVDEAENVQTELSFSEIIPKNQAGETEKYGTGIFRGLFFKAAFNKDFGNAHTIIIPRRIADSKTMRENLRIPTKENDLEEVHLEDPEFMEKFAVYSNDQIGARIVLQADVMANLLDFLNHKPTTITGEVIEPLASNDFSPSGIKRAVKLGLMQVDPSFFIPYFSFKNNNLYLFHGTLQEHFSFNIFEKLSIETIYDHFRDVNRSLRLIDDLNLNLDVYKK